MHSKSLRTEKKFTQVDREYIFTSSELRKALNSKDKKLKENLFYGLVGGLFAGLFAGLVAGLVAVLVVGLVFGLVAGLVVGLVVGLVTGLVYGLVYGLVAGLVVGLVTQIIALISSNPLFSMFDFILQLALLIVIQTIGWIIVIYLVER